MKLPPGCGSVSGKVARLSRSLYGLKQAFRTLYKRLVSDLKRIGFEQSMSDPCVLHSMMGDETVGMVAIHVDDILHAGTESLATVVVEALGDSLATKNLGEVMFFCLVANLFATTRLAQLRFLKRVTSEVFSGDLTFVAPGRSLLPLPTITGPWRRMRGQEVSRSERWWGAWCGSPARRGPTSRMLCGLWRGTLTSQREATGRQPRRS